MIKCIADFVDPRDDDIVLKLSYMTPWAHDQVVTELLPRE